jgi:hypothetical protein
MFKRTDFESLCAKAGILVLGLSMAWLAAGCGIIGGANAAQSSGPATPTPTPTPGPSPSPSPTPTPAPKPTPTPTPAPSPSPTPIPTPTPVPSPTPTPTGPTNGWANRSAGVNVPGGSLSVLSSQSFDTFPATNRQEYIHYNVADTSSIATDCVTAADGCSLKFSVLKGYVEGNPGWFDWNFSPDLSKTFGNGQEFYVQYRERLDPGMLNGANFPSSEGFKSHIITEGDTPTLIADDCVNTPGELVMQQDGAGAAYPIAYHNCGYSGGTFAFTSSGYDPIQLGGIFNTNFLDQDADGCPHYSGRGIPTTDPPCWNYIANEWFTVQVHVKIGTFNNPNSVVEVWLAHEGQPAQLIVNASDAALVNDGVPTASGRYGKISLLPFQTAMSGSLANTGVWYDDLMASTRRIPDPNVATPNPPDSLFLSGIKAGSVTVNWRVNSHNGTAQDDTAFQVERCTGSETDCFPGPQSGFALIGTTAAGASSFVDNTAASGNTYTYRVRARNAAGSSAYTTAICFNGGTTCGGSVAVP